MRLRGALFLGVAALSLLADTTGTSAQSRGAANGKASPILSAAREAVEKRFRQLDATTPIKLDSASVTSGRMGAAVLDVAVKAQTDRKLDLDAQTAYSLIWEALTNVPDSFAALSRIKVSLVHSARTMRIDCPVQAVKDSYGYMDPATLRNKCAVR